MENRTSIEFTTYKATFFEATLTKNNHEYIECRDSMERIASIVNIYLQDGYQLKTLEKVEREQIQL